MGLLTVAKYGWRALKILPEMAFGTSADVFGQGVKSAAKRSSIWTKVKAGAKAVEADVAKQAAKGGGGFLTRTAKSILNLPKDIWNGAKFGIKRNKVLNRQLEAKLGPALAKQLSKGSVKGALSGMGKVIAKRMPLIGVLATLYFDGPKIYDAFKNRGFVAGLKECTGVGVELGGMAAGAAIGSCFGPVGTLVGGIVGGVIGMIGRNFIAPEPPEKEQAQKGAYTENEVKQLRQMGLSDEEIAYAQQNGLSVEEIRKFIGQAVEQADATRVQKPQIQEPIPSKYQTPEQAQSSQQAQKSQAERMKEYQEKLYANYQRQKPDYNAMLQQIYANVGTNMGINVPSAGLNAQTNLGYQTPGLGNPYSNDMMYKQAFGANTGSNPFINFN